MLAARQRRSLNWLGTSVEIELLVCRDTGHRQPVESRSLREIPGLLLQRPVRRSSSATMNRRTPASQLVDTRPGSADKNLVSAPVNVIVQRRVTEA